MGLISRHVQLNGAHVQHACAQPIPGRTPPPQLTCTTLNMARGNTKGPWCSPRTPWCFHASYNVRTYTIMEPVRNPMHHLRVCSYMSCARLRRASILQDLSHTFNSAPRESCIHEHMYLWQADRDIDRCPSLCSSRSSCSSRCKEKSFDFDC